jgi:hypothetical protein
LIYNEYNKRDEKREVIMKKGIVLFILLGSLMLLTACGQSQKLNLEGIVFEFEQYDEKTETIYLKSSYDEIAIQVIDEDYTEFQIEFRGVNYKVLDNLRDYKTTILNCERNQCTPVPPGINNFSKVFSFVENENVDYLDLFYQSFQLESFNEEDGAYYLKSNEDQLIISEQSGSYNLNYEGSVYRLEGTTSFYTVTNPNGSEFTCVNNSCNGDGKYYSEYLGHREFTLIIDYMDRYHKWSSPLSVGLQPFRILFLGTGLFSLSFGLLYYFAPNFAWEWSHFLNSWTYRDATPSRAYYTASRRFGLLGIILGVVLTAFSIILYRAG